jgi:hypothetical protein
MKIGSAEFDFVNTVSINSTWEEFTDTASIRLPKKLRPLKNGVFNPDITVGSGIWNRGDEVSISLGYILEDNSIEVAERFTGYLTRITTKNPLEFECEDKMWKLKQTSVPRYSKNSVTLSDLLKDILPIDPMTGVQYKYQADAFQFNLRFTNVTVGEVFDYLKKTFGITTYFQNGILYSGFAYKIEEPDLSLTKEFTFQENIIEDQLDYTKDEDIQLNVTVINFNKDNTKDAPVVAGSSDGEKRVFYTYNLPVATQKNIAEENLRKLKYEGFRGSFTTFLNPVVKHGDSVKLINPLIPDQNGVYLVRRVVTTNGISGGRQEIFLDRKIA